MAINDNTSYELFGYQVKDLANKIKSKAEAASLAPVATSGLYSDLTGKPTIPTVYNGTLTIQQNGTTVDTFTANSSADKTINISVPTDTSELTNDSNFVSTNDSGIVTADMINWSTLNIIIDDNVPSTFFNGSYSKSFSVPVAGYYEINAPFSALAHKQANTIYYFRIKIDNVEKVRYMYASVNSDSDWGTCRRTITSTPFVVELTAGTHTISTADGNFWDTAYSLLTVTAITAKFIAPSAS